MRKAFLFVRAWWHVLSGSLCTLVVLTYGVLGWVGEVNAHLAQDPTSEELAELYIRQDVWEAQMKVFEEKLDLIIALLEKQQEALLHR